MLLPANAGSSKQGRARNAMARSSRRAVLQGPVVRRAPRKEATFSQRCGPRAIMFGQCYRADHAPKHRTGHALARMQRTKHTEVSSLRLPSENLGLHTSCLPRCVGCCGCLRYLDARTKQPKETWATGWTLPVLYWPYTVEHSTGTMLALCFSDQVLNWYWYWLCSGHVIKQALAGKLLLL